MHTTKNILTTTIIITIVIFRTGGIAPLLNTCLTCTRPWVQSPGKGIEGESQREREKKGGLVTLCSSKTLRFQVYEAQTLRLCLHLCVTACLSLNASTMIQSLSVAARPPTFVVCWTHSCRSSSQSLILVLSRSCLEAENSRPLASRGPMMSYQTGQPSRS